MDVATVAKESVSERVVTLMTRAEKLKLEGKARKEGISIGELVRRSVDAYDPDEMRELEQLAIVACMFREHAERALAAVDRANATIEMTRSKLSGRNQA